MNDFSHRTVGWKVSRDLRVQPPTPTSEYSQYQQVLALSSQVLERGIELADL